MFGLAIGQARPVGQASLPATFKYLSFDEVDKLSMLHFHPQQRRLMTQARMPAPLA